MTTADENPCLRCTMEQDCCNRLRGLKVTRNEFERYFQAHSEKLSITPATQSGAVLVISTNDAKACPNWKDGGCTVYNERPIECRLFPYTTAGIVERRNRIEIGFHRRTNCPLKNELLMPEDDARSLIALFGKRAFGEDKTIIVYHAEPKRPTLAVAACLEPCHWGRKGASLRLN